MSADVDTLFLAFAAMEQAELPTLSGDAAFHAFANFPTQAEIDSVNMGAGAFTVHVFVGGANQMATIGTDSVEDNETVRIETYVVLTQQQNELSAQQVKAQKWARWYRAMLLKHRMLTGLLAAPNNGSLISNDLAKSPFVYEFAFWKLFGMVDVGGLRIPLTVDAGRTEKVAGN